MYVFTGGAGERKSIMRLVGKQENTCCSISKQCIMLRWDEQTMSTCWFAVNNAMPHLNVSGPNNAKADYANWGYRGHRDVTMAPSWLSRAVCVRTLPIPLGFFFFFFFPTDALPRKPPILRSLSWGLIIGAAVNQKVKGRGRGSAWSIPPGLINQLVFPPPPIRCWPPSKQRSERDENARKN